MQNGRSGVGKGVTKMRWRVVCVRGFWGLQIYMNGHESVRMVVVGRGKWDCFCLLVVECEIISIVGRFVSIVRKIMSIVVWRMFDFVWRMVNGGRTGCVSLLFDCYVRLRVVWVVKRGLGCAVRVSVI